MTLRGIAIIAPRHLAHRCGKNEGKTMPAIALALVLAAAVFHAAWNRELHTTEDRPATMAISGLVAGTILLPAIVITPPWSVLPLVGLSALTEAAYALCLSAAYRRGALALTYPIARGTAPLLVTLGGWVVLAEPPGPMAIAGACALAAGLILIATAGLRVGRPLAIGFALLTGGCVASYSLIDARAVREVSALAYLGLVLVLQGLLLVGWIRGDRIRLRRALGPGIRVAVGSTLAYLLVLLAFQRAGAGRVATLREVSVLIGLLLAGGKPGGWIWLGAGLVVVGAIMTAA
jgi:drug/metabolite transporter (DMT)-like permease